MNEKSLLKVRPSSRLSGKIRLPGDKSLSHRALLLASLGDGSARIGNCLVAGVTTAMMDCLKAMGVEIRLDDLMDEGTAGSADLTVLGRGIKGLSMPDRPLDCRGSATTMRLLAGILAGQDFESTLDGNWRLRERPMDRVVEPLRAKGARIATEGGHAPLTFFPSTLSSSTHLLPVASAQVKSALMLAGLFSKGSTTVVEPHSSRDHTERMLRNLGVEVREWHDSDSRHWVRVEGGQSALPTLALDIPADPSSAAFLVAAGLLVRDAEIELPGVCINPGRIGLYRVLESMGAKIEMRAFQQAGSEPIADLHISPCRIRGTTVGGATVPAMIDEFPIFAVVATQADGTTVVRDAQELRLKESDRIAALAEELTKMGAEIEQRSDGFVVHGPVRLRGTLVNGRGDHRLAMSLAVAGLVAEGETSIEGWTVLEDSFPGFPRVLKALGADVEC